MSPNDFCDLVAFVLWQNVPTTVGQLAMKFGTVTDVEINCNYD